MTRTATIRNAQHETLGWAAGSFAMLAAVVCALLFTAAPAQADHAEDAVASHFGRVAFSHFLLAGDLLFGHAPVVEVHHRYDAPRHGHGHRHHARCGHGRGFDRHAKHHYKHDRRDRGHHARHRGHGNDYAYRDGGHRRGGRH